MLRTASVTLILAASVGLTLSGRAHADADIYRWKDAQGIYHYSDQWVPGSELIKSSGRQHLPDESAPPSTTTTAPSATSDAPPEDTPSTATAQAVKADVAKVRAEQCKEAKDAYEKSLYSRRLYKQGKDGQREYLSDAELDAYRLRVRNDMEHLCGTSADQTTSQ